MRASYGWTRQRRDDRIVGTLVGCVIAAVAVAYAPIGALVHRARPRAGGDARLRALQLPPRFGRRVGDGAGLPASDQPGRGGAGRDAPRRHARRRGDRASLQPRLAALGVRRGAAPGGAAHRAGRRLRRGGVALGRARPGLSHGAQGRHRGDRRALRFGGPHGRRAARDATRPRRNGGDADRRPRRRRASLGDASGAARGAAARTRTRREVEAQGGARSGSPRASPPRPKANRRARPAPTWPPRR